MADRQSNQCLRSKQWSPGQLIYDYDTPSFHAFLIIEGSVDIYSKKGLKLNTLYDKEIFGESSLLLNKKRSVAAIAGENGICTLNSKRTPDITPRTSSTIGGYFAEGPTQIGRFKQSKRRISQTN